MAQKLSQSCINKEEITMTIKEARKAANLTQQAMSDTLGIPLRTIVSWEIGERKPPAWVEKLILDALKRPA